MPLFDFVCDVCRKEEERLQKQTDPSPECHGHPMRKKIGASNFALKGGGWAKDGYGGNRP